MPTWLIVLLSVCGGIGLALNVWAGRPLIAEVWRDPRVGLARRLGYTALLLVIAFPATVVAAIRNARTAG